MSRVELAKIPALTFYKDAYTAARRTSPIPQLVCHGYPFIRCTNLGGSGTDVDWKCEADLPESLRFGKVDVSCEGWSRPGDNYVLKGSCSLDYRLVQVPGTLRNSDGPKFQDYDWAAIIFWVLWIGFLAFILYNFVLSCFRRDNSSSQGRQSPSGPRPGGGFGSGWFPGTNDDTTGPPPPYSKTPTNQAEPGWRPGFWTGAFLGGVANHLWNGRRQADPRTPTWDWERERVAPRAPLFSAPRRRTTLYNDDDRGEGSSNLGAMRSSTGFGGSNVR
ncbi:hypothetical protein BDQ17DRAFT_1355203 [Cyathus striatus]|nr:hypothetical protein BDQ17DRAFT_1355203 [Cyathus striatus]